MKQLRVFFMFVAILYVNAWNHLYSQEDTKEILESEHLEDQSSDVLLNVNASQFGSKYRETQILMQNRHGVRIEYTLDRSDLQLWITPQVGKSMSYVDQNWSNRDDHTDIFDRIQLPGCDLTTFKRCDWDPFHSILYFEDQTLHIAQIYDQPAVLLWFEKEGVVDFKIYGQEYERTDKTFIINYSDRERDFQAAALIGKGNGKFRHQTQLDKYRSIHARAELEPNQVLLISGELRKEQIGDLAKEWIKNPVQDILTSNEEKIAKDLSTGQFKLRNHAEMQKLLEKSRRVALSMQPFKGFMRSTNQYIYYLLWYRDGGMNTSHIAYSGWTEPAYHHTKFALHNPNFTNESPEDIFFGQIMGGPLTKWQEDGLFYVVWPAFTHWTQTGDKSLCEGKYLKTMEKAMDWLEKRCFDEEKGLFGRYFACETPMTGSRDDGYDNVTGAPTFKWKSEYEGNTIVRSYDNYINFLHYSTYLMLSAMETEKEKADEYYQKAVNLKENMVELFKNDHVLPSYGFLETQEGDFVTAKPYGMDIWDYVWGLSLPPFEATMPEQYKKIREQLRHDMTTTEGGYFHCVYFAMLTSMDTELHNEDSIMAAMEQQVPWAVKTGKYLPMPYAMPEMFNISEENPFHDIRPLVYSIAPWLSAVTNLGLHRMPFGIAVRGTKYLENLENFVFKEALLDISFRGEGKINRVLINDKELQNTYQIPEDMLKKGDNTVVIEMTREAQQQNILTASTVQLHSIRKTGDQIKYNITAYGKNVLTFKNLDKKVRIISEKGKKQRTEKTKMDTFTYYEFEGRGDFSVILK
jgi:hypothetical protein